MVIVLWNVNGKRYSAVCEGTKTLTPFEQAEAHADVWRAEAKRSYPNKQTADVVFYEVVRILP